MKKITTKKQYEYAKFLTAKPRHVHNWVRLRTTPKRGKKIGKLIQDDSGGFVICSLCSEVFFLNPKQLSKYRKLIKAGYGQNEIQLTPHRRKQD